jgi:ESCRT-II complex subunit VPS25
MSVVSSNYKFPDFYHFPPFFTLQPSEETRKKQYDLWLQHIVSYLKAHKKSILNIQEDAKTPLFQNSQIQRGLNTEGIKSIADYLVSQGYALWHINSQMNLNNNPTSNTILYLSWNSFNDWAAILYRYAQQNSLINTIVTLYELQCGEQSKGTEFYNLNEIILLQAIKVLEAQARAAVVPGENIHETGIKFKPA